jgi:hypothetical protein
MPTTVCLFVCLFVSLFVVIKPDNPYLASCLGLEENPHGDFLTLSEFSKFKDFLISNFIAFEEITIVFPMCTTLCVYRQYLSKVTGRSKIPTPPHNQTLSAH